METRMVRNSNIELMRLVCMVLILFSHWAAHGGYIGNNSSPYMLDVVFSRCAGLFGSICDVIFVAITGYFMINQKFNLKRFIEIAIWINVYSIFATVASTIIGWSDYNIVQIIVHSIGAAVLFPKYWFMKYWMMLYVFSPFINVCLKNSSEKLRILLLLTLLGFTNIRPFAGDLTLFIFWYALGAEIRLRTEYMTNTATYVCGGGGWMYYTG